MEAGDRSRDAELVTRWKAGDESAFKALYDAWFDRVYDLVRRIVRDADDATDITHDVFVTAMRARDELRDPASFGGWLLRVARNRAIDRTRQRRPLPVGDPDMIGSGRLDGAGSPAVEDRARSTDDPAAVAGDRELATLLWESTAALAERDAEVISLHVRQGLEPVEIAEVLGVSRTHAAQLLHRSRERLGDAIRARVLWRSGAPSCDVLASVLSRAGATRFDGATARLVLQHARGCSECDERQRLRLAPATLFSAVPLMVPAGAREAVWTHIAAATSTAGVPGTAAGAGPPRAARASRAGRQLRRGRHLLAAGAAAVVAVGATAVVVATRNGGTSPAPSTEASAVGSADVTTNGDVGSDDDPLVRAVFAHDAAEVGELLQSGADPQQRDGAGSTVLYLAAGFGFGDVVAVLLDDGAAVDGPSRDGSTALHGAAERGQVGVISQLLAAGATVDVRDGAGRTPLLRAVFAGQADAVSALAAAGADPSVTFDGGTPLHVAATFGLTDVARVLLDAGADRDAVDGSGRTPADVAREQGNTQLAEELS